MTELSAEKLRKILSYDELTGEFLWRVTRNNYAKANTVAGYRHHEGYILIRAYGREYPAHRLAWLYVHGRWPTNQIDHINRDRADNRLSNLREATNAENQRNRGLSKTNSSGYKGVSWNKRIGKWKASIRLNGKLIHLGYFTCPAKSFEAYCEAAKKYHGEFRGAA